MRTQSKLQERIARVEEEIRALKQQLSQLMSSSSPEAALHTLETLWQLAEPPAPSLSLQEARQRLAQTLPPKWGSRLIRSNRAAK